MIDIDTYMRTIRDFQRVTPEREKELAKIIQNGRNKQKVEKARQELIQANLLLVVNRAIAMEKKYSFLRINIMDLISEGNIGLMKAVDTYNGEHESNANFGSYAFKIIEHHMKQAVKNERFVYLPDQFIKYKCQIRDLKKENENLTDEMIKENIEISEEMLAVTKSNTNVSHLEDIRNEDGESVWSDTIEDTNAVKPDKEMEKNNLAEVINQYVSNLNEREQIVIKKIMMENKSSTYTDLSKEMGISRSRISQIYFCAIRKLRRIIVKDIYYRNEKEDDRKHYYWDEVLFGKLFRQLIYGEKNDVQV